MLIQMTQIVIKHIAATCLDFSLNTSTVSQIMQYTEDIQLQPNSHLLLCSYSHIMTRMCIVILHATVECKL
jgi:hypothetical protein